MLAPNTTWRVTASCLGFVADSYDLFAIDLVILILKFEYSISVAAQSVIVSTMLAGVIIGQLTFGAVADQVGRKWASVTTASLMVIFAVLSGFCRNTTGAFGLPAQLGVCRFFMGLGVGGEYPLTASITAEASEDAAGRPRLLALLVSMQGVGMLLSCGVALIVLSLQASMDLTWRFLLAFGALPSLAAAVMRWQMRESEAFERARHEKGHGKDGGGLFGIADALWRPLVGTAAPWFLVNIYQYSLGSFKSSILNDVMPNDGLSNVAVVFQNAQYAAITGAFAIAGFAVGHAVLAKASLLRMQMAGFLALLATFGVAAVLNCGARPPGGFVSLLLLGLVFLFSNAGPNLTTFVVPADAFPTEVRATCHGFSAAAGKFGAVVGTALLSPAEASFGMGLVYAVCAVVAAAGTALTWAFLPRGPVDLPSRCDLTADSLAGATYGSVAKTEDGLG